MAAKKPSKPKAAAGRARDKGDVSPLTVEVDTKLRESLDSCVRMQGRSRRTIVERALRLYFLATGHWQEDPFEAESPLGIARPKSDA